MKLLYVDGSEIAKYKKGGWVLKSTVNGLDGKLGALMLRLETITEYENWDSKSKCVRT